MTSSNPQVSAKLGYRPDLDALRAVSCLIVLVYHAHALQGWPITSTWASWFQGWIGVDVFFVLSGFLITALLVEEERRYDRIHLIKFYLRRQFRLVPAYYVAIGVYGLFTLTAIGAQYSQQFHSKFLLWLCYLGNSNGHLETDLLGFAWTLRVEQRFYLLWPVLFFCLTKSRFKRILMLAIIAVAFLPWNDRSILSMDRMRDHYALLEGCLVALIYKRYFHLPAVERLFTAIPTGLLLLPVAAAFAGLFLNRNFIFLFSLTVALLVFSLTMRDSFVKRMLSWSPLVWLGQRS